MPRRRRLGVVRSGLALAIALVGGGASIGSAQVTLDGSLGPRPPLAGPDFVVGAALGQVRGQNLFHSFDQFNVRAGESVTFSGPDSIANILGRVTGGRQSTIDGLLRSTIPGANLFLVNPAGVIFGPGAALDLGGAFHATTADVVRFADGGAFHASPARASTLSAAHPSAFGFLGARPASIAVNGSALGVAEGGSLSLVGGDVHLAGATVATPGGRLAVVSAGGPAEVPFEAATQTPDLDVARTGGGLIRLSGETALEALSTERSGRIAIRGGRLVATEGSRAQVISNAALDGEPIGIDVRVAGDVVLDGSRLQTGAGGAGRGGDIVVTSRTIDLAGNAQIGAFAFGSGAGGAVRLAADAVALRSDAASIQSIGGGTGDAGTIEIAARHLTLDGGGVVGLAVAGRGGAIVVDVDAAVLTGGALIQSLADEAALGGDLTIRAREKFSASGANSLGIRSGVLVTGGAMGRAGRLSISTPALWLDGAIIGGLATGSARGADLAIDVGRAVLTSAAAVTSLSLGTEQGGSVTLTGSDSISLSGGSSIIVTIDGPGNPGRVLVAVPVLVLQGGRIGTPADLASASRAGDVDVTVDRLVMTDGALITSSTLGPGRGGTIAITARESVSLSEAAGSINRSSINSLTAGAGDAGRVVITTPAMVVNGASIDTGTLGTGAGGDLVLDVGRLTMTGGASLGSGAVRVEGGPATTGRSGNITIRASDSVVLSGAETSVTALTNNAAAAGTVAVTAPVLAIADGALISGTTGGAGRGGDIHVDVGRLTLTGGGLIDSTAQAGGAGGTVRVTASDRVTIAGADARTARPSRLSSNSQGTGSGGDVILRAPDIVLRDGGALQARSFEAGNAGNIRIEAGARFRSFGGTVTSDAASVEGGNVVLTAPELVLLADSQVTTSVQGGLGRGGNIAIGPGTRFVVLDGSQVRADAFGGPGGNVQIGAEVFLRQGSTVSASSALGVPGVVAVQAPITDISGGVAPLPEAVPPATALLREACRARIAGSRSSSFLVGRGHVPPDPAGPLLSPVLQVGESGRPERLPIPDRRSRSPLAPARTAAGISCR